ncbi:MAG TPA: SDR family oxidoreductase [Streptosporangiaceae bacterium]|nr:SDR family oxidoreductase [Streptosporangiaceae bacterium]
MTENLTGRVCVITGASSGIGKAAAIELARRGATMVLVARDRGRGESALAEVGAAAAGEQPSLELADLASLRQVRELAARLAELPRIDVLVNNAGLVVGQRLMTEDGIEHTFAVNHLAPFLLTNLLLGKLTSAGRPARVVTVSSTAHRGGKIDLDTVAEPRRYLAMMAYSDSKLANVLFTAELARKLTGTEVTANCLHPGTVRTGFGRSGGPLMKYGVQVMAPLIKSAERGARTVVYLASSPDVTGRSGGYYVSERLRQPSRAARDEDLARRLWDLSAKLTGLSGLAQRDDIRSS